MRFCTDKRVRGDLSSRLEIRPASDQYGRMSPRCSGPDFSRSGLRKWNFFPSGTALVLLVFFLPLLVSAVPSFRFAWLSDTHVGSPTGEEDLRAAVRDINSITGLSFVVLSGDVTEYGSLQQFRLAKEILD